MFFHFGCCPRGMTGRLSGKRPRSTGPAYSTPPAGWVEEEGGHTAFGTAPANVGATWAFFGFILQAGIAHAPQFAASSLLEVHP
jgi:hypothetical protein